VGWRALTLSRIPMAHFRDFFDYRAFLVGMGAAVVGALLFRALTSFPFWLCFVRSSSSCC
jgi:hypothetical protein